MNDILTALLFIAPIALTFGPVLSNKKTRNSAERIINRIFE